MAADLRPVEDDLSGSDGLTGALGSLLGDFFHLWAGYQQGHADHVVTEGLAISQLSCNEKDIHTE